MIFIFWKRDRIRLFISFYYTFGEIDSLCLRLFNWFGFGCEVGKLIDWLLLLENGATEYASFSIWIMNWDNWLLEKMPIFPTPFQRFSFLNLKIHSMNTFFCHIRSHKKHNACQKSLDDPGSMSFQFKKGFPIDFAMFCNLCDDQMDTVQCTRYLKSIHYMEDCHNRNPNKMKISMK